MNLKKTFLRAATGLSMAAAIASSALIPATAQAQAKEQYFGIPSYRVGPFAAGGTGFFGGIIDYLQYVNMKEGGVNGVRMSWAECETEYNAARGVECYQRLLKSSTGQQMHIFEPLATPIAYGVLNRVDDDKVILTQYGYGRSDAADGRVFPWVFATMTSYWSQASAIMNFMAQKEGGVEKLKGKKIALVYHDSPFGKEPIPLLDERQKMHGFELSKIPVTAPGVEQKSAWLQVRQQRPDYVLLWGWGVMNSTALKEAQATGYPRDKMYGVWWAGAEPDVKDVGDGAKGYNALNLNTSGQQPKVIQDILKFVHEKGQGTGPKDEVGSVLYTRGVIIQALGIEAVRRAQERFGKGKVMTGEQVRWGLENLSLDDKKLAQLGLTGVIRPFSTSCQDHMGSTWARVHTWNGSKWDFSSDWYQADEMIIKPMVKAAADKYAGEKKITRRTPQDCQS